MVKVEDEKGSQTYRYDATTGFMTELIDSAAGAFKAEHDVTGQLTSEVYPNGMTAVYTHDAADDTTAIEYIKTAHCATSCPETWFGDHTTPSVHRRIPSARVLCRKRLMCTTRPGA